MGLLLSSCTTTENKVSIREFSRVFKAPYESVWRATQQALLNYPMNVNNMDTGNLQTLYITGKYRYKAPHQKKKRLASGYQYRINVNIIRSDQLAKVVVNKQVRLQKSFFAEPEELGTDGFEEKAILYRIKRELLVEKLIKRQIEKKKTRQPKKSSTQPKSPFPPSQKPKMPKNYF